MDGINGIGNPMSWSRSKILGAKEIPKLKNHSATLVGSKLYIFGGYNGQSNHNTMYILDCTTYQWTTIRNIGLYHDPTTGNGVKPEGRNGHTATLADGQIWILGGWLGHGPLAAQDLWAFDTTTHEWVKPQTSGTPPGPCNMHTADYIPDLNKIFVFRGGDGRSYLNQLHTLDLNTMTWKEIQPLGLAPPVRANHASSVVDNMLYIFGGWDGKRRLNDLYRLDTRVQPPKWVQINPVGELPQARAGMTLTNVNGKLVMFGGSGPQHYCFDDVWVFDTSSEKWKQAAGHETDRLRRRSTKSSIGESSSLLDEGNPNAEVTKAELNIMNQGPKGRTGHTATFVGRKIIFFGGSGPGSSKVNNTYFNDVFELDTDPPPAIKIRANSSIEMLSNGLRTFINSKTFSDVTFVVEGKNVYAHKVILCLMSERFRAMFAGQFQETKESSFIVEDVSYDVFILMMQYLYSGTAPIIEITNVPLEKETVGPQNENSEESDEVRERFFTSKSNLDLDAALEVDILGNELYKDYALRKHLELVNSQSHNVLNEGQIVIRNVEVVVELLSVADMYMLDHLKEACEVSLKDILGVETVDALLDEAEKSNAQQLRQRCLHFLRNYQMQDTLDAPVLISEVESVEPPPLQ